MKSRETFETRLRINNIIIHNIHYTGIYEHGTVRRLDATLYVLYYIYLHHLFRLQ
jgi:hypothetical protein